jgi:hypothetical protein
LLILLAKPVCQSKRDAVKPAAERFSFRDAAGFLDQQQKRRLNNVVGIPKPIKMPTRYREHHRAMPTHENRERLFVVLVNEKSQQVAIRKVRMVAGLNHPANLLNKRTRCTGFHGSSPRCSIP